MATPIEYAIDSPKARIRLGNSSGIADIDADPLIADKAARLAVMIRSEVVLGFAFKYKKAG